MSFKQFNEEFSGIQEELLVGTLLMAYTSNGKDVLSKADRFSKPISEANIWLCWVITDV